MARTTMRYSSRLDIVLFGVCAVLALVAIILPRAMHQPVASVLRRSVVAPLMTLQQGAERWRAAWATSHERAIARDSLALRAAQSSALLVENDRLRRLVGLGRRLQWGFAAAEALHGGGSGDRFTSVVLTAGSNAGVVVGSPVVAPEGLVGIVQTVEPRMSIAIIYPHSEFRASAMAPRDSAFGIVAPHLSGGRVEGPDSAEVLPANRYMLELRGIPYRRTLKPGTLIVTSGLGGTYPPGIPIGTVMTEIKTPEVWARTYLLRPIVNPAEITSVMILLPPKVRGGTGAVWEAPTSIDSATRGIVVGGDSLTRAAAAVEAARRAALDSAVRASRPDTVRRDSVRTDSLGRPVVPAARAPGAATPRPATPADTVRRPRPDTVRPQLR